DNSTNESGLTVQRALDSGGIPGTWMQVATLSSNATQFIDSGLNARTVYWYRIGASNIYGTSFSATASATTPDFPPAAPSSLVATAISYSQIGLRWNDTSTNESGFNVQRAFDSGGIPDTWVQVATLSSNATQFTDSGLNPRTVYWYRIGASNTGGTSYSAAASATTPDISAPHVTVSTQPSSLLKLPQGTAVVLTANATGDGPFTYQWKQEGSAIADATNSVYNTTAQPVGGSTDVHYTVSVSNIAKTTTSSTLLLTVVRDTVNPTVAIKAPKGKNFTTGTINSGGTATDNVQVDHVTLQLNSDAPVLATLIGSGPSQMWTNTTLRPHKGNNTLTATAYDLAGNPSSVQTTNFTFGLLDPFNLTIVGGAANNVSVANQIKGDPRYDGVNLVDGDTYTVTAMAPFGSILSNYTANVSGTSSGNKFTFTMTANAAVTVTFITNPFLAGAGTYNGLFSDPAGVAVNSAGMLKNFVLKKNGVGQGKLLYKLGSYNIKGTFGTDSTLTTTVTTDDVTLAVRLTLDNYNQQITGTVTDQASSFLAKLTSDRAGSSPLPAQTQYTMLLSPADQTGVNAPGGWGYADIKTSADHQSVTINNGVLADSIKILPSKTVKVSKEGTIPLFVPLAGAVGAQGGLFMGVLHIDSGTGVVSGTNSWLKLNTGSGTYPGGFPATTVMASGGVYNAASAPAISASILDVYDPAHPGTVLYEWNVSINSQNVITRTGGATNLVKGSINKTTGTANVTYTPTGSSTPVTVTAMVDQSNNDAKGAVIGTSKTAPVVLH
ncbi:MAG: hypothetical protein ACXWC8_14730, partial [Limisphaerales bacterium]